MKNVEAKCHTIFYYVENPYEFNFTVDIHCKYFTLQLKFDYIDHQYYWQTGLFSITRVS